MFRTTALAGLTLATAAQAQIDPRGVYFHRYSGPFSGSELVQIVDQPGDRRYEFSDLRGAVPYRGEVGEDGLTAWDTTPTTSGSGAFAGPDRATFTLGFNGQSFSSDIWRAPFTGADFITSIESREPGDTSLAGTWRVTVQSVDMQSGAITGETTDTVDVSVTGDLMRLTLGATGVYYQGVFESAGRVGFRVQRRASVPEGFATYDGSAFSENFNLLGDLRLTGTDSFEAVLLTEQRGNGGNLRPGQVRLLATRVPAPGGVGVLAVAAWGAARRRRS